MITKIRARARTRYVANLLPRTKTPSHIHVYPPMMGYDGGVSMYIPFMMGDDGGVCMDTPPPLTGCIFELQRRTWKTITKLIMNKMPLN